MYVNTGDGMEWKHQDWCAFGVDVAGTNLRRDYENITRPAQCDTICRQNTTGCTFWWVVWDWPQRYSRHGDVPCVSLAAV
jgi:hypothetical protein